MRLRGSLKPERAVASGVVPSLLRIALLLLAAYVLVCVLAFVLQRRLQYFPDRDALPVPPGARWKGLQDVTLHAADGVRLEAFFWPGGKDTVVLLLHGNAGHRGDRLAWMADLHDRGWPVFLLDYRGYGGSGGSPSEDGLVQDAEAAADWLATHGHDRVVYLGSSIGCGVATRLAARRPPTGLILQSGAVSLLPVAQRAYPFLPLGLLMRDRFDVADDAARVTCPALSIHGDLDEIVPLEQGRALHEALGGPKQWWVVEGAGHNDVVDRGGRAYLDHVDAFLGALPR